MAEGMLGTGDTKQELFGRLVFVAWGELTSSKLKAQSYEKAGQLIVSHL